MHYDPESNILSIELVKSGKISHVAEFGNFIIHLSKANTPILIEVLDASKFVKKYDKLKLATVFEKVLKRKSGATVVTKLQ